MTPLKMTFVKLYRLFVDDGNLATAIIAWLALLWLARPYLPVPPTWHAPILFIGLLAILLENVLRRSRKP